MKEFKATLIISATILIVFFIFMKFVGPIPFTINSINTTKSNLFTVTGTGESTGVPDTAQLSVGVTKTGATVAVAQEQVNSSANKITADLKKIGVKEKDIKTTNYSVNPNYDFSRGGTQTITGYTVTQNFEISVSPIDLANKVIDTATADGANLVGNVIFTFNDEKKKELEQKARVEAIKEAKEKAQRLAGISGLRLGKIVDVQESAGFEPVFKAQALEIGRGGAADTQLQPGENKITSNITLSYETF